MTTINEISVIGIKYPGHKFGCAQPFIPIGRTWIPPNISPIKPARCDKEKKDGLNLNTLGNEVINAAPININDIIPVIKMKFPTMFNSSNIKNRLKYSGSNINREIIECKKANPNPVIPNNLFPDVNFMNTFGKFLAKGPTVYEKESSKTLPRETPLFITNINSEKSNSLK